MRRLKFSFRARPVMALGCGLVASLIFVASMMFLSGADASVTLVPPSTTLAPTTGTTALAGASVAGYAPTQQLLVSLSTTMGTLSLSQTTGLTLSYGYGSFSGSSFSFTGLESDVNAALSSLALTGTGRAGPRRSR